MRLPSKLLVAALSVLSLAANAATVPNASLAASVSLNFAGDVQHSDASDFPQSLLIKRDPLGFVSLNAVGEPSPSLHAAVDIGPGIIGPSGVPFIDAQSVGFLRYFFQIVSPISTTIPITVDVSGDITGDSTPNNANNTFLLDARWALLDSSSAQLAFDGLQSFLKSGPFHREFSRTVNLTADTNRIYQVIMTVNAQGTVKELGAFVGAKADLDPVFSFGPGVDPSLFSFEFSDGIGNSPQPVPLPPPLTLLGVALLAFGSLALHRKHRHA
jgi:hypothetical protein